MDLDLSLVEIRSYLILDGIWILELWFTLINYICRKENVGGTVRRHRRVSGRN